MLTKPLILICVEITRSMGSFLTCQVFMTFHTKGKLLMHSLRVSSGEKVDSARAMEPAALRKQNLEDQEIHSSN